MTNLTLRREEDLFLTKSAEGYEVPVDIELLKEIYEISQDIQDVEDNVENLSDMIRHLHAKMEVHFLFISSLQV